ncbi:transcriptional regulator [Nakamurella antarctica]|uniref:Transcriptional regulator n=1 Tax=Nakamurella antarctica TaxID=1902245 RepID=A0A3G8ZZB2_9ACTN|nr:transcriptional regulator [Nakamurella antarctica]
MSKSRSTLLEQLRAQSTPVSIAALVELSGLHENTLREHLASLVRRGLCGRQQSNPSGRGRPAWLYYATGRGASSEYAGLAATLAMSIATTSADPTGTAVSAGEHWGRTLVEEHPVASNASTRAAAKVIVLLDQVGYSPQVDRAHPTQVRLTRCPLLEIAYRQPDVVCAVHLGLVRGALMAHDEDPEGIELQPFAAPGVCLLTIPQLAER